MSQGVNNSDPPPEVVDGVGVGNGNTGPGGTGVDDVATIKSAVHPKSLFPAISTTST